MARRRSPFRRRRSSVDPWLMFSVQRRTIESMAGRLSQLQHDVDQALEALTEAESRIADLEARVFGPVRYTPPRKTWLAEIPELPWIESLVGS